MRLRITILSTGERAEDLRIAARLRLDLWGRSGVDIHPLNPLQGTHRDTLGRAYIEFATSDSEAVRRVLRECQYGSQSFEALVEVTEPTEDTGPPCQNCGNIAGAVLPTECPNCGFRDISPCPICHHEVSRQLYIPISGDLFRCPNCQNRVRFRFNDPMFLQDGSYNQPLIVIDGVEAHHAI
jgi:hypothetical protein